MFDTRKQFLDYVGKSVAEAVKRGNDTAMARAFGKALADATMEAN